MVAQQVLSGRLSAQGRTAPIAGASRSASALSLLARKRIATCAGLKQSSSFVGVSSMVRTVALCALSAAVGCEICGCSTTHGRAKSAYGSTLALISLP